MFNLYGKNDADIRRDVISELQWDPSVNIENIAVKIDDGIVTMRGTVPSYFGKGKAEKAAWRVVGVRAVADELEVNIMAPDERTDGDIAKAALQALEWTYEIPQGVKVTVDQGWVTLQGEAEWDYERNAAKRAVAGITGVRGVTNDIKIKSTLAASDIKLSIEEAISRAAVAEGKKVTVAVQGDTVTLEGKVNSFNEMEDAKNSAWSARGVREVVNNIEITH